MKTEILKLVEDIDKLKKKAKKYFQNKSIDLKERWEVFEKTGMYFADNESYVVHFDCLHDEAVMADERPFYPQRGETMECTNIVDVLIETKDDEDYDHISEAVAESIKNLVIDDLKEEILQKYLWSFRYDW